MAELKNDNEDRVEMQLLLDRESDVMLVDRDLPVKMAIDCRIIELDSLNVNSTDPYVSMRDYRVATVKMDSEKVEMVSVH